MKTISSRIVDLITTATDKRFEPVAHMADEIVMLTLQQGECTPQALVSKGFVQQDVISLWHFANALAAVELKHTKSAFLSFQKREVRYA